MNDDDNLEMNEPTDDESAADKRFRILVCIDGSDESYQSLRYAAKMGRGVDADIVLLYVRAADKGLSSGGLEVRVARQNMLEWGLEFPWINYLNKGRDLLIELGNMADDWDEKSTHTDVEGDPLGDNKIEYTNKDGKKIVLKLKVATGIASGILEQWELGPYDLIILGTSSHWQGASKSFWDPAISEKVAVHAPCSVLVARELDIGHGHLICVDGSERSLEMARKDAILASRCECPISLLSVSLDDEGEEEARENVNKVKEALEAMGIEVEKTMTRVGEPVDVIVDVGTDYSLIVLSDTAKTGFKRFFMGSVAFKVLDTAYNSVMIVR